MNEEGAPAGETPYTLRALEQMSGLGRGAILSLVRAGVLTPVRGARQAYRFSFQDLVLLRMARALYNARIAPRQLQRALVELKASLPQDAPLSGLRIQAVGRQVAVGDGASHRDVRSGQLLMNFDNAQAPAAVAKLERTAPAAQGPSLEAGAWLERAQAMEERGDAPAAEAAYRQALALEPARGDAYVNLGVLLCDAGRAQDALDLFDHGLRHGVDEALLHFNRAIALEDLQREEEALAGYRRCLELAPEFADAHYNAARLHEKLGQRHLAIRHYSAYRRLAPDAP